VALNKVSIMNCEQIRPCLNRFHDAEMNASERSAVEIHLGVCPACAAELAAIAELSQCMRRLSEPEPPMTLWDRTVAGLHDGPSRGRRRLPLAAALATAAVLGLVALGLARQWIAGREVVFSKRPIAQVSASLEQLLAVSAVKPVSFKDAAKKVGFEVLSAEKLPDGYCLQGCCLCDGQCCDVVRCKYQRGPDSVFVFQCPRGQRLDCGCCPTVETSVHGKPAKIIQHGGCLAAAWQTPNSTVGVAGARDLSELVQLMAYVDDNLTRKP
jgi:anti-sigma factor RsiW